jgi:RNA polymerase sigma factor (sigma-70 family)
MQAAQAALAPPSRRASHPPLSPADERRLTRLARRGEEKALDTVVRSHLAFVVHVANKYRGLGLPLEDLIEEGTLGLLEALQRYDPSRGFRFTTYAVWWIRRAIIRALSTTVSLVRVPRYRSKLFREAKDAHATLMRRLGRRPRVAEVAEVLGVDQEEAGERLLAYPMLLSLDQPLDDGQNTLAYYIRDHTTPQQESELLHQERIEGLRSALEELEPRERKILAGRYGLDGAPVQTLRELAGELGITKERVRQIEIQARKRLAALMS